MVLSGMIIGWVVNLCGHVWRCDRLARCTNVSNYYKFLARLLLRGLSARPVFVLRRPPRTISDKATKSPVFRSILSFGPAKYVFRPPGAGIVGGRR